MKFTSENCTVDFGDETGIFWYATITIDNEYDSISNYRITGVYLDGKVVKIEDVPQNLRDRIYRRMEEVSLDDCAFSS